MSPFPDLKPSIGATRHAGPAARATLGRALAAALGVLTHMTSDGKRAHAYGRPR
jgi:hypothetical protein